MDTSNFFAGEAAIDSTPFQYLAESSGSFGSTPCYLTESSNLNDSTLLQHLAESNSQPFHMANFTGVDADVLIGLSVTPGYALVDTGAQHGVVGAKSYAAIEDGLAARGMNPRVIETLRLQAAGVGGTTSFKMSAEVPVAIG